MIKVLALIYFISSLAFADTETKMSKIKVRRDNGKMTIDLNFDGEVKLSEFGPVALNKALQFDITGAQMQTSSQAMSLKDAWLKSLYVYNLDADTIRFRINAKEKSAEELKPLFQVKQKGNRLTFQLQANTEVKPKPAVLADVGSTVEKVEAAKVIEPAAEKPIYPTAKLVASEDTAVPTSEASVDSESTSVLATDESEKVELKESTSSQASMLNKKFINVLVAVSIVGLMLIGLAMFMRKWKKVSGVDKHVNNIKVLSQHFLGPKKSLCVVRVAGETLLVGVTDNNINLIKSLSLLDEEIPDKVPLDFSKTLKEQQRESQKDQSNADMPEGYQLTHINDVKKYISRKYADL